MDAFLDALFAVRVDFALLLFVVAAAVAALLRGDFAGDFTRVAMESL
jgi:hypothetical protein